MISMKSPISFKTFIGNARTVEILKRSIEQDRLPHALIFSGPEGVGKCTLALLVAQYLNCLSPANDACGICSACQRIMAIIESRHQHCRKGEKFCGTCPICKAKIKSHPDIRLIEPEKTTIGIDQVRDVIGEVAFQPLEARYRVVIFDPAEQMRSEAQNSLLKTLEEPPSRTVIILIATNPYLLLETIRSRSRILNFGEIPEERIMQHLVEKEGRAAEDARISAALCGGSLSAALAINTTEYRGIREQAFQFVALLLTRGAFLDASNLAAKVAKDKDFFRIWLESVSALLQDIYYSGVAVERVGQRDLLDAISALRQKTSHSLLLDAIEGMRKLKSELQYNVNRQIALEALFISTARRRQR
jgi:DNA polymerase III subunit delta'